MSGDHQRKLFFWPVPYLQHFGALRPNNIIFICGLTHPHARRFTINLKCRNGVIAFHFDVRFNAVCCRNVIVRNTFQRNGWGREERCLPSGYFPFEGNKYFEVIILTEPLCFKVAVNNQHLLQFRHRIRPHDIDSVQICGDVSLSQVRFQE